MSATDVFTSEKNVHGLYFISHFYSSWFFTIKETMENILVIFCQDIMLMFTDISFNPKIQHNEMCDLKYPENPYEKSIWKIALY